MKVGMWVIGLMILLAGCSRDGLGDGEETDSGETGEVLVRLSEGHLADSAQVFFFRSAGNQDTLILREIIYEIEQFSPRTFLFRLPAGKYRVCIFGNVPSDRVVVPSPPVLDRIFLDYDGGREASAIYFGQRYLNVGVDTVVLAGMLLLSASVELTIDNIPPGVEGVIVRLTNTAAGVSMNGSYLSRITDPPLTKTLSGVAQGNSYVVQFYCFPAPLAGKNTLEVECYGATGSVVYSGNSAPFEARPGENRTMTCRFATASDMTRSGTKHDDGRFYLKKAER